MVKKKNPEAPIMPQEIKNMRKGKGKSFMSDYTEKPPQSAYKKMGYSGGGKMKMDPQYKSAGSTIFKGR